MSNNSPPQQQCLLMPLATFFRVAPKNTIKFLEMGWLFLYYVAAESFGLILWPQLPTWQGIEYAWIGYPHTHFPYDIFLALIITQPLTMILGWD